MQFRTLFILAFRLTAAAAWTIPQGCPDGVYKVFTDASGVETHTFISPPSNETTFIPRGTSIKRSNSKRTLQGAHEVVCNGMALNAADTNTAVQGLKNQCRGGSTGGGEIGQGGSIYSVAGTVAVWACSWSWLSNHCYEDEIVDALQSRVSSQCGGFAGGYDTVVDRAIQYGYWHSNAYPAFCYQEHGHLTGW